MLLVGPVGSGKSTLLKILAGLYRPSEGRVRLGQADLWETDPLLVSTQVGYLPQSVHLFRGTLRSNLCLTGTAGDDRLLEISRQLGIDAIAAGNPHGMDLPISEGGEGLSGGQRQLVALARVFINQPRMWLLDEPTASLDREIGRTRVAGARGRAASERHSGRQHASAADGEPAGQPRVDHAARTRGPGRQAGGAVAADGRTDRRDSPPPREGRPMWFDGAADEDSPYVRRRIERLQQAHRGRHGALLIVLAVAVAAFIVWASVFQIDEVARAAGRGHYR